MNGVACILSIGANMHDVITIGVPLIAILAGILLNRADVKDLRAEMREGFARAHTEVGSLRSDMHSEIGSLRAEIHAQIAVLQSDMRQFYHLTGKLEARVDAIEKP